MNKKHPIAFGIVIILLVVGLSGCTDFGENKEVEIIDYEVTTNWKTGDYVYGITDHVEYGFYHNISDEEVAKGSQGIYYKISGTLKNIAGRKLDKITIDAVFYDIDGVELFDTDNPYQPLYDSGFIGNLPTDYTEDFTIKIYKNLGTTSAGTCKYFNKVESFSFVISIT